MCPSHSPVTQRWPSVTTHSALSCPTPNITSSPNLRCPSVAQTPNPVFVPSCVAPARASLGVLAPGAPNARLAHGGRHLFDVLAATCFSFLPLGIPLVFSQFGPVCKVPPLVHTIVWGLPFSHLKTTSASRCHGPTVIHKRRSEGLFAGLFAKSAFVLRFALRITGFALSPLLEDVS